MSAVRVRGLSRAFGGRPAVQAVDLDVAEHTLFGIVGPDGAGKTTLLRLIVGVLAPDAGSIEVLGHDTLRDRAATRLLLGYMSQAFSLYEDLSIAENIAFFAALRRVPARDRDARARRILEATGLLPFVRRPAGKLSGGMKQKLGLTCTLVHEPRVLFLDEPTNGVDPVSRREFWEILGELRERIAVVVTTPSLDEAERCDHVALMAGGRILRVGTPAELRAALPHPVWEVETPQPFQAAEALDQALPGASVHLFGDRVHVVSGEGAEALGAILRERGHEAHIRQVEASLEDAYVHLLRDAA